MLLRQEPTRKLNSAPAKYNILGMRLGFVGASESADREYVCSVGSELFISGKAPYRQARPRSTCLRCGLKLSRILRECLVPVNLNRIAPKCACAFHRIMAALFHGCPVQVKTLSKFGVTCAICSVLALGGQANVQEIIQKSVAANEADYRAEPEFAYKVLERELEGSKTYKVTMIDGSPYHKLIAVNGKPLSKEAQDAEERKQKQAIARRRSQSPQDRQKRIASYKKDRQRDHAMMQELTKAFTFTLIGEEKLGSFDVYHLRADPKPGYQPPSMETQVLTGMKGDLWIDKASYQWVKVMAEVVHPVSIAGFLARVEPGTQFELEKMPVENGIWLPKHFAMKAHAKVFMIVNRSSHEDNTFSDYQRVQ